MQPGYGVLANMLRAFAPLRKTVFRLDIAFREGNKIVHPLSAAVELADDELVFVLRQKSGNTAAFATAHAAYGLNGEFVFHARVGLNSRLHCAQELFALGAFSLQSFRILFDCRTVACAADLQDCLIFQRMILTSHQSARLMMPSSTKHADSREEKARKQKSICLISDTPRPVSENSSGWQVSWLTVLRPAPFPNHMVQWFKTRQSAYSCGGSHGIGPELGRPHHVPFSSSLSLSREEPSALFLRD